MAMPLQEYADLLMRFAREPRPRVDASTPEFNLAMVSALFDEGALLGIPNHTLDTKRWINVSLSARGAVLLAEWQGLIRRSTIRGRVMANLERALWALVGALLAMLAQWATR